MLQFFRFSFILLFLSSCFQQRSARLIQNLEGTVVSLSDVFHLKCVLKTGESLNKKVDWTNAEHVVLEDKMEDGRYKMVEKSSVVYEGFDQKTGKKALGHVSDFSYVSIKSVEEDSSSLFASTAENSDSKIIQKGNLHCENLLTPEQHPFIIAKANHSYNVEFQVVGNNLRALIIASAEDIPFQSLPYSVQLSDGRYGMPIGGYNIGLGYLEEIVNSDFEATRSLNFREVPIKNSNGLEKKEVKGISNIYPKGVQTLLVKGEFKPFKTLLESGGKKDVYPKHLLAGDWYYENTVVGSAVDQSHIHTRNFSIDDNGLPTNNIRIVIKENYLIAYSLNMEADQTSTSTLNRERSVFTIPIQHRSYESNGVLSGQIPNAGLNEVLNKRISDEDKDFIQVQFNKMEITVSKALNLFFGNPLWSLEELHLSKDYISFVLYDEKKGSKIKHSLLRPKTNSTYTPLRVSQKSHNLFPAFYIQKRVHDTDYNLFSRKYQDSYITKRFNTNEPIVYRFSTTTPKLKYVRDVGRETINIWNQVFKKAGVTCAQEDCFVLDESADADVGDIRYNVLNLIDPRDLQGRSGIIGYGPSLSNLATGETISSTTNLALNKYYSMITRTIYRYIMEAHGLGPSYSRALFSRKKADFNHLSEFDFMKKQFFSGQLGKFFIPDSFYGAKTQTGLVPVYGLNLDDSIESNKPIQFITSLDEVMATQEDRNALAIQYKIATGRNLDASLSSEEAYKSIIQSEVHNDSQDGCSLSAFGSGVGIAQFELIRTLCKTELSDVVKSESSPFLPHEKIDYLRKKSYEKDFESKIIACVEKVLPLVVLGTSIHEMGHNISMYHNFAGSADKENFLKLEDFQFKHVLSDLKDEEKEDLLKMDVIQPSSSTLMDYVGPQVIELVPGMYDVDFVRFIYGGHLKNRITEEVIPVDPVTFVDLNSGEPLNINHIRHYKVCYGSHIWNTTDPFCQLYDVGTTALEILENEYQRLEDSYYHTVPFSNSFFVRSLPFYHKWRLELSSVLQGQFEDPYYLSSPVVDAKEYSQTIKTLCEDDQHKLNDLCRASRFMINKIMDDVFSPDYYCTLKSAYSEQIDQVPFRYLHRVVEEIGPFKSQRSSCKDFERLIGDKLGPYKVIGEVGKPLSSMQFSTDKNNKPIYLSVDRVGSYIRKINSILSLFISTFHPVTNNDSVYSPISIMDEPDIRDLIHSKLEDRFLNGVKIAQEDVHFFDGVEFDSKKYNEYTYNFSNDIEVFKFAGYLFRKNFNASNPILRMQNSIQNLVSNIPYSYISDNFVNDPTSRVKMEYLRYYSHLQDVGGFITNEPQEDQFVESMVIEPVSDFGRRIITGIKDVYFKRGILNLWAVFTDLYKEKHEGFVRDVNEDTDLDETVWFEKVMSNNILQPVANLFQEEQVFQVATMILLYDYFERGADKDLVTDGLIPFLQALKTSNLIGSLGLSENGISIKASASYKDEGVPEKNSFSTRNPLKPEWKSIQGYFDKNPASLLKVETAKTVLDIYLLELFKSSVYESSDLREDFKTLSDQIVCSLEDKILDLMVERRYITIRKEEVNCDDVTYLQAKIVKLETPAPVTTANEKEAFTHPVTMVNEKEAFTHPVTMTNEKETPTPVTTANEKETFTHPVTMVNEKETPTPVTTANLEDDEHAVDRDESYEPFFSQVETSIPVTTASKEDLSLQISELSNMLDRFYFLKKQILKVKKLNHFVHNKFLREIFIRDLFIAYSADNHDVDLSILNQKIQNFLNTNPDAKKISEIISSPNAIAKNYIHFNLLIALFSDKTRVASNAIETDAEFHKYIQTEKIQILNFLIHPYTQILAQSFQQTIQGKMQSYYNKRYKSIFKNNSLDYFLTHDSSLDLDFLPNYFDRLFHNRLQKEMKAQEDVLLNTFDPYLDIYRIQ